MSLASTAAPFDNDNQFYSEVNRDDTLINRKRLASSSAHNKTQKRMQPIDFNSEKVIYSFFCFSTTYKDSLIIWTLNLSIVTRRGAQLYGAQRNKLSTHN